MIPDLRTPDAQRQGITADTVCLEDLVASFVASTPEGLKLAHQDALVSLSRNIDRHAITGESLFATRGLDDLRALMAVIEHQLMIAKMLRSRVMKTRLKTNQIWLRGQNPTEDGEG